jgi:chorismate lyase/3-hydroxybenzoate synthase
LSSILVPAVAYADGQGMHALQTAHRGHLLGVLAYGERTDLLPMTDIPNAWTGLRTRDGDARYEVWMSRTPVAFETIDGIACTSNDEVLFGTIEFAETATFEADALAHYLRMFALLDRARYPHLLRIWHYLPQIHLDEDGLERYKRFSVSRHEAFVRSGRDIARDAPAASALGRRPGGAVIAFLAGRRPAVPIENPRQTSAYRYPAQYGPRGPTFARAAYAAWGEQEHLYVSGTASIVGHQSAHPGDPVNQAEETIRNLRALVTEADARAATGRQWEQLLFKVYLRPGVTQDDLGQRLRDSFGEQADVLFLEAEICRRELLLEIEAIALRPAADR